MKTLLSLLLVTASFGQTVSPSTGGGSTPAGGAVGGASAIPATQYLIPVASGTAGTLGISTLKLNGGVLYPSANSTTAVQINKADGTTNVVTLDTTGSILSVVGALKSTTMQTTANCTSAASPATCTASSAGSVVMAATTSTIVVNTSVVTASSQIFAIQDNGLGTKLSVTCNTSAAMNPYVSARSAGTSFTVKVDIAPTVNPLCLSFFIVN